MEKINTIKRISRNAIYLAILCVVGMFALPLGENIKVSLQLLIVLIIGLTIPSFIDGVIITSLYLLLGLFLPIYAGFKSGISPTFGFVISFVVIVVPLHFINKIPIKNQFVRMGLACFVALILCYLVGCLFFTLYMHLSLQNALLITVVPYIPFDIVKIIMAVLIVSLLPKKYVN